MKKKLIIPILLLTTLTGCFQQRDIETLPRKELFSLSLGKMEDQIDLFQIEGTTFNRKNRIYTKDGMFYIVNGNSAKIMQFTSYGDLIFLLYNPFTNPAPVVLNTNRDEGVVTTMAAVPFDFNEIGEIAVDAENNIYIEDTISEEHHIRDDKLGVILNSRILRFNRKGEQIDYFGKEGIENSLFPFIEKLYINNTNELIVQCRTTGYRLIYWMTSEGAMLYSQSFSDTLTEKEIPIEKNSIVIIDKIIPSMTEKQLYVQITFFNEIIDPATKTRENIEELYSRIYRYNIESRKYEGYISIPPAGKRKYYTESGEVEIPAPSFEFVGIARNNYYFFIRPTADIRTEVLIIDGRGNIFKRSYILIEEESLFSQELVLSPDGMFYALLSRKTGADIVLWRSDKLLDENGNEDS